MMHSTAMVTERKSAQRYILKAFPHVIDFPTYNLGLPTDHPTTIHIRQARSELPLS